MAEWFALTLVAEDVLGFGPPLPVFDFMQARVVKANQKPADLPFCRFQFYVEIC
jgi:hypothetical protein